MLSLFPASAARKFLEGRKIITSGEICDTSCHSRTHAKCTMNLDELVCEMIQRSGSRVILKIAHYRYPVDLAPGLD